MADSEDNSKIVSILSSLKLHKRLEREKGLKELQHLIETDSLTLADYNDLQTSLSSLLLSAITPSATAWEELHGALMAANLLIEKEKANEEFKKCLKHQIGFLLENDESRIRLITGELVGHLCRRDGVIVYEELQDQLLSGIRNNLERDGESTDGNDSTSSDLLHDTAGWKCLETYMSALQYAVEGCGFSFGPLITAELFDLLFSTFKHTNRFVRETGYKVIASIVNCSGLSVDTKDKYWLSVAIQLAEGLSDNWSQVRMSASIATRQFLTPIDLVTDSTYLPHLLPPMCLNRYYVAEGVRLYSQETWRLVTKGQGIQLVEKYIENIVSFYIQESEASNHAVREAACACIAELGTKVSTESVRPQVPKLVGSLLDCFRDESWPVRDAACLACGNFVSSFPEDCRSYIPELLPLLLGNLEDSIPSVRQGGAVALSCLVKTYGKEVESTVIDIIKERLPLVAQQPSSNDTSVTSLHPGVESGPAVFGVVKRVHDNDIESHSNQQMYSCGSLAPKMKRGGGGGCMHSDFHKPAQPWEKSEGCIHLLAELSQLEGCRGNVVPLLPLLAEATKHKHYIQHYNYLETVMKQLPVIAKAIGKRSFKQYLELFFECIFYGLSPTCSSPQLKMASSDCLRSLTVIIGPAIMRGRVEQYNPSYLSQLDHI